MAVVAFVRPEAGAGAGPVAPSRRAGSGGAEGRLRLYGRGMRLCFLLVLALWASLLAGCLLSLFLRFESGIVVGEVDGSIAFRFWPPVDYFSPQHALSPHFVRHAYPLPARAVYAIVLIVASAPFCGALASLARLFGLYVSPGRNPAALRRPGHCVRATGWAPVLLGPVAHAAGVLKPVTGVTDGMIACVLLGLVLLAISHVMEIGRRIRQEQEEIL